MSPLHDAVRVESLAVLSRFRTDFYDCLTARADALFELADAVLCTDGPVRSLVDPALVPEHRRGHGSLYAGLNRGGLYVARLRQVLAGVPLPRAAYGRLVLAVDVSPWLRPDAGTVPDRSFCHTYGRGGVKHQMMPGWPYSVVVALESGRTSWSAFLDAVRLAPGADLAAVTARQVREVVERLVTAGQWTEGDPDVLIVLDAGYDTPRIAHLVSGLPIEVLGRTRSDAPPGTLPGGVPPVPPEGRTPAQARRGVRLRCPLRLGPRSRPSRSPTPASTARPPPRHGTGCTPG